jgi:hypothetical protein
VMFKPRYLGGSWTRIGMKLDPCHTCPDRSTAWQRCSPNALSAVWKGAAWALGVIRAGQEKGRRWLSLPAPIRCKTVAKGGWPKLWWPTNRQLRKDARARVVDGGLDGLLSA